MATALPPSFDMLKQQTAQSNPQLTEAQRTLIDDFLAKLGMSSQGFKPAQAPQAPPEPTQAMTKAVKSQDIEGRRAYVMPEGPVVYAERERPAASTQEQINPEVTGESNVVYAAPNEPLATVPPIQPAQELSPRDVLQIPALAGPGGSGRSAQASSLPPPSASQKIVAPQDQKRQRKTGEATNASAGGAMQLQPGAKATVNSGSDIPNAVGAKAPTMPSKESQGAGNASSDSTVSPTADEYVRRLYPQQTGEGLLEEARAQQRQAPKVLPNSGMQPVTPQYNIRKQPVAKPTTPPEGSLDGAQKPTSALPPTLDQLKSEVEKSRRVKPAMYADVGDVSPGQGSMLVEIKGGKKIPVRKQGGAYQANFGTDQSPDWNTIAEGSPLASKLGQLEEADQGTNQYLDPIGVVGSEDNPMPIYGDASDPSGYNLGTAEQPEYRNVIMSPDMIPSMYDSETGRIYNEGVGDYVSDGRIPKPLNQFLKSFDKAYDIKRKNFVVALNDQGVPALTSADEAGRRIIDRTDEDYLSRRSTNRELQNQATGTTYNDAINEIYKQLANRDLQHLGIAMSIQAGSPSTAGLAGTATAAGAAASNRARSNVAIDESSSSGASVSGIQIDTPFGRAMRARGLASSYSYEQPDSTDLVLLSRAAPYSGKQQNVTPNDVQQYYASLLENYPDAVRDRPKRDLSLPTVNPFVFLQQFDQLRKSKNPQAFAHFVNRTVGQSEFGQGKMVQVGNYRIGVTAAPPVIETTISRQGSEKSGVTIGSGGSGSGSTKAKPILPRNGAGTTYTGVDPVQQSIDTDAQASPMSSQEKYSNDINMLAYMTDSRSTDPNGYAKRFQEAIEGTKKLSDAVRSNEPLARKLLADGLQMSVNNKIRKLAQLAKDGKMTVEMAKDLKKMIEDVYKGKPEADAITAKTDLELIAHVKDNQGLPFYRDDRWIQTHSKAVKYLYDNIAKYNTSQAETADDTKFQLYGISQMSQIPLLRDLVSQMVPGAIASSQNVRDFAAIMFNGKTSADVDEAIKAELGTTNYRTIQ